MRQIQLVGPVDKRVIAYPLFKICDTIGKVLVITDDANFRRFSDDYSNEFTVGRSDFYICNDISESIMAELGLRLSSYDYVIFINTNKLLQGNDCTVYCHGQSQLICSEDVIDDLDTVEHMNVTISTSKPKEKNELFCSVTSGGLSYVWSCEENKYFLPCKNQDLAKLSAYLFAQVLGFDSKENFASTLAKELE